ncbi:MAG TPA: AAA family ATPase, partial [Pirellulales bacterium]|nr:AAA family ATPase [Pirellulales bacterium]
MNLLELEIDGFGVWTGLKLDDLSQRLTAFYGPNEAGKTTLLQFVRTMLYGFSPERRRRYLPPLHGGRAGGALLVENSLGRFNISRHADDSPRTPPAGELRIVDATGALQKEHLLDRLLGRVDEATFNHVFAIGLREIQELGALGDTAAAELLYGLSTGLDRVSLIDVLRELKTSRERLLSTEGKPCQIGSLLAERDKIVGEIDELRSLSHRYSALVHQRGELDAEIKRREEERGQLEHSVRVVEAAL